MAARYEGVPIVELLPGRNIKLKSPLVFIDDAETRWSVPAEAVVDGASIPRAFWSIVGGPLDGDYRDASIIHDWYCDRRTSTWQATHRVFFDAMLTSGVGPTKAKIMYYAVLWGGPRWEERVTLNTNLGRDMVANVFNLGPAGGGFPSITTTKQVDVARPNKGVDEDEQQEIAKAVAGLIESDLPSLDEIEALAEQRRPAL